jgi:hypothetical protein
MNRVLSSLAVLAGTILLMPAAHAADPSTPAVTLSGLKTINLSSAMINGDTTVTLDLLLGKDTTLRIVSKDPALYKALTDGADKRVAEFVKRSQEIQKLIDEAKKNNDTKKVQELKDQKTAEGQGILLAPVVVEGVLTYKDKKWHLAGSVRPFDAAGKDKGVKAGTCTLRGEAVSGEFKAGDVKSLLAVRAGDLSVVLTGPAAKESVKGLVRATGTLRLGKSGEAVLEATKVDPVKR